LKLEIIRILNLAKAASDVREICDHRDEVLMRFSPLFQSDKVGELEEDDFRQFLEFKHNKHWSGLHRQPESHADMGRLRRALSVLVDETMLLRDRVNVALEIPGLGVAKVSAILLVAYPSKYGIWNGTSVKALKHFGLWPDIPRGATEGDKYAAVNNVLVELAEDMDVDLWTLDGLWWGVDLNGVSSLTSNSDRKSASSKGRLFNNREKSIWKIKDSVLNTVRSSNGQTTQTTVKNKELLMSELELETCIKELLDQGGDSCAITGLPFEFEGDGVDTNMRPSLDRIDSDGHYEASNVQLVCRFINFWKQATPDNEFRRLIHVVRELKIADIGLSEN